MESSEIEEIAKRVHQYAEAWEMALKSMDKYDAIEAIGRLKEVLREMRRTTLSYSPVQKGKEERVINEW